MIVLVYSSSTAAAQSPADGCQLLALTLSPEATGEGRGREHSGVGGRAVQEKGVCVASNSCLEPKPAS